MKRLDGRGDGGVAVLRERDVLTLALLVPYCEAEALLHIGLRADRVREEHRHERPHVLRDQRLDQTGQAADSARRLGVEDHAVPVHAVGSARGDPRHGEAV